MKRVPALDGVRALAVAAVVAFHLNERQVPGGFLGVDVFFVLSGFLITTLLLAEWQADRTIALVPFWRRRARRLLPLLLLTVVAVALVTPLLYDDVAGRVRGEVIAAVAQGVNWFEAVAGRSYFDTIGRPAPLRHLWSLGVEAQFYALWPAVVLVALRSGGTRRVRQVATAGVALSFVGMALFVHPGGDPSRLYYGTDTRIGTLLVGALLALAWRHLRVGPQTADLLGAAGLLALVLLVFRLDGASVFAYRGGLFVAALAGAALVVAALVEGTWIGSVLGTRPFAWLGTRSYAIYLVHWPVIVATRPGTDVAVHGWALLALRLGITFALSEIATRAVDGALRGAWPSLPAVRRRLALVATGLVVVAAVVVVHPRTSAQAAFYVSPTTTLPPPTSTTTTALLLPPPLPETTSSVAPTAPPAPVRLPPPPSGLPEVPPDMPPASPDVRALAVGESVLMAAGGEVQRAIGPGTVVDADVARQPDDVLQRLAARRAAGYLDRAGLVVVQMGTNGAIDMRRMERMAELVVGVPRVVAVTVHVDRPWGDPNNRVLQQAAERWPWLRLADWDGTADAHPEWLGPDGVHPNREGARQYAGLVRAAAVAP